jgi:predicted metal-dependent peptidase
MKRSAPIKALCDAEWKRLQNIRFQLLELHPFWGSLLMSVRVTFTPTLPTFGATDCVREIWLNPVHTQHLSHAQLGFVVLHELGHILMLSGARRNGRDMHLWNCATDYAINRMIMDIRHPWSRGPLYGPPDGEYPQLGLVGVLLDSRFRGQVAETIYERLAREMVEPGTTITIRLQNGEGTGETTIDDVQNHGGGVDIHLPFALSEEDYERVTEAVEGAVQAWSRGKKRGNLPGEALRVIKRIEGEPVHWETILAQRLGHQFGGAEWDTRRPNRRWLSYGFIAPSVQREEPGNLVVAIDTSGSMDTRALGRFMAQLDRLAELAPDTTLIVCDSIIHDVVQPQALRSYLQRGKLPGGGGTNHRPVFDWIAHSGLKPALFVGITDLASRFPEQPPPFPVLWLTPTRHAKAPWGDVLVTQ